MNDILNRIKNFVSFSSDKYDFNDLEDIFKEYIKKRVVVAVVTTIAGAIFSIFFSSIEIFILILLVCLYLLITAMYEVQKIFNRNTIKVIGIYDSKQETGRLRRDYYLLQQEERFIQVYTEKQINANKGYEITIYVDSTNCQEINDNTYKITNPIIVNVTKTSETMYQTEEDEDEE